MHSLPFTSNPDTDGGSGSRCSSAHRPRLPPRPSTSGLNYYYFISGLIGILTMVFLRKTTDEKKLLAQLEANKEKKKQKNGGKAGGGLMAKLEALQKEQERLQQERMNKGKK